MNNTKIIKKAIEKANEIGINVSIALVDTGGHLLEFKRMDGAILASIDASIKKAKTSILFSMETEDLMELGKPGGSLYGMEILNGGMVLFGGGIPIFQKGELVGAIGISGGSVEEDIMIARNAVSSI